MPFRPLIGAWAGTLTYTDYGDDSTRVALYVRVSVAPARDSADAPALRLAYGYTEPDGRAVEGGTDLLVPGPDPSRLRFGETDWTVVRRETGLGYARVVIERQGADNDRPATIRETLDVGSDALTLCKRVRYAGTEQTFERHIYRLRSTGERVIPTQDELSRPLRPDCE